MLAFCNVAQPRISLGPNGGDVSRCGWGSATLFFAEQLPASKVTGFSNSRTQKEYIDAEAARRGITNVEVITGDVADYEFEPDQFDRVVSVEVHLSAPTLPCQSYKRKLLKEGKIAL